MKYLIAILFSCATFISVAQTNYVKNGDFERYDTCPYESGQIIFCKGWQNAVIPDFFLGIEYFNTCAAGNLASGCPVAATFYQYPHSSNGMSGVQFYYDKTFPPPWPEVPFHNRENLQSKLSAKLNKGKIYCVSFWVNLTEASGYAHNKIGAYLDDGGINTTVDSGGEEIISVIPQVYSNSIIRDTQNWVKIQGSFVAKGNETYITIGNFFPNDSVSTEVTNYLFIVPQYSYYLIDDVSVVPIDAKANAGVDRWVELGKSTAIGPVEDSTARAMDCKWYKKGVLIDSGNVITVNASSIKYAVDTYVVVQNICGHITSDTMLLRTVPLGIPLPGGAKAGFTIFPNPSTGNFTIITPHAVIPTQAQLASVAQGTQNATIFDLLSRVVLQQNLFFNNKEANLNLNLPSGTYILELKDEEGIVQRGRLIIE